MMEGDLIGFLASALVLATFAMTDMRRLRATAILSNLAFIVYAALFGLLPVRSPFDIAPAQRLAACPEARRAPIASTPSKATLLAIEALHFAGPRSAVESQSSGRGAPEIRTRLLPTEAAYPR
jgi:hypothetical protein